MSKKKDNVIHLSDRLAGGTVEGPRSFEPEVVVGDGAVWLDFSAVMSKDGKVALTPSTAAQWAAMIAQAAQDSRA